MQQHIVPVGIFTPLLIVLIDTISLLLVSPQTTLRSIHARLNHARGNFIQNTFKTGDESHGSVGYGKFFYVVVRI